MKSQRLFWIGVICHKLFVTLQFKFWSYVRRLGTPLTIPHISLYESPFCSCSAIFVCDFSIESTLAASDVE